MAARVLEEIKTHSPKEIQQQMDDNIRWIKAAMENHLVVGSQARILYADAEGRIKIAEAFNKAIAAGEISAPVIWDVIIMTFPVRILLIARLQIYMTGLVSRLIWLFIT